MLLDIFFPKYQSKKDQSNVEFIYKYAIKWFLIILIVTLIFFIINNLFYNTLENEINTSIYENPGSPIDLIRIPTTINDNISTTINDNISTKFINEDISTNVSLNKKALNIISNPKFEGDTAIFDNLKAIFENIKNIKSNNQQDFNISL